LQKWGDQLGRGCILRFFDPYASDIIYNFRFLKLDIVDISVSRESLQILELLLSSGFDILHNANDINRLMQPRAIQESRRRKREEIVRGVWSSISIDLSRSRSVSGGLMAVLHAATMAANV